MVTSPDPGPGTASASHEAREVAESFGADADRYDRARPDYPAELVALVLDGLAPADGSPALLDVGIGTGTAARMFAAAGCRVTGVEPDPRMADVALRAGFAVDVARFEDWEPAGRRFDVVVAGQAWHWVDPAAGAARAAQVLRPGGRLALFWNVFLPEPDVAAAFADVYRGLDTGLPFVPFTLEPTGPYEQMARATAAGLAGTPSGSTAAFGRVTRHDLLWRRTYSRDEWLDQVPTFGGHSRMPAGVQARVLEGIGAAVDARGGSFVMPYTTLLLLADRR